MPGIFFLAQGVPHVFRDKERLRRWLRAVVKAHKRQLGALNYVLMSDEMLLNYNIRYLGHRTLTDVISFPSDDGTDISGDILISLPRVTENAALAGVSVQAELRRIMVHGLLHFLGHTDHSKAEKEAMRQAEDYWLGRYSEIR